MHADIIVIGVWKIKDKTGWCKNHKQQHTSKLSLTKSLLKYKETSVSWKGQYATLSTKNTQANF